MKHLFKGILFQVIYIPLICILYSGVLSALILFFGNVLGGNEYRFTTIWRQTYLWWVVIGYSLDIVLVLLRRTYIGLRYSVKFKTTFAEILETYTEHKLFSGTDYKNWTAKQFNEELSISKSTKIVSDAVFRMFYK